MNIKLLLSKINILETIKYFFIAFLTSVFVVELILSLEWRVKGDVVFLHYMAYLINEHDFLPYKDLFELNLPGTYLFHIVIGKLFGYTDFVLRTVNMVWLLILFSITWFIMKPFGKITAYVSCILFGLIYLGFGPYMMLERDALALIPITLTVLLVTNFSKNRSQNLISFLIGVLFACAALIKPHFLIGLPVVWIFYCISISLDKQPNKLAFLTHYCLKKSIIMLLGLFITVTLPFLWLWNIGVLDKFLEILFTYIPLYTQINLEQKEDIIQNLTILYRFTHFEGLGSLLIASAFGVYLISMHSNSNYQKRVSRLILTLAISYSAYVLIAKKIFFYHWIPYFYFASLGTAMLLYSSQHFAKMRYIRAIPIFVFTISIMSLLHLPHSIFNQIQQQRVLTWEPKITWADEVEDQIKEYMRKNMQPNDKIQPLIFNAGALEAMLDLNVTPATPYIIKLQFYHNISNPYIQYIRKDFIKRMTQEMPKFIIEEHTHKLLEMDGHNKFPELKQFIKRHYVKDYIGNNFEIYKKIDNTYNNYDFNQTINFKNNGNMSQLLDEGWSHPESSHIWSEGKKSSLNFHTQLPKCNLTVALTVSPFYLEGKMKPQELKIVVNGKQLLSTILTTQKTLNFHIPIDIWNLKSPTTIEFLHPNSISPQELGVSQDSRELGFAFQKMIIKECQ